MSGADPLGPPGTAYACRAAEFLLRSDLIRFQHDAVTDRPRRPT